MLQCSFLFIVKEIIIFMTSCKLVIVNYKGLYNANMDVHCSMGHFWQRSIGADSAHLNITFCIIKKHVQWFTFAMSAVTAVSACISYG